MTDEAGGRRRGSPELLAPRPGPATGDADVNPAPPRVPNDVSFGMATWRNGSAFGFDRRRLRTLTQGTKRLQVRVLRWSYFFFFEPTIWAITRTISKGLHEFSSQIPNT